MKKKKMLIIMPIVGCLLLAIGLAILFLIPKKTDKEIFTESIKQSIGITKIKEVMTSDNYQNLINEGIIHFNVDGSLKIDGEKGKVKLDSYYEKEKLYLSFDASSKNELKGEALIKDNKAYYNIEDVTDKFYYEDLEKELHLDEMGEYKELFEKFGSTIEKVVKIVGETVIDTIDNKKIETTKTTKTINGKEYDVKKYSYDFTGKDLYDVLNNIINKAKNDKELYDTIEEVLKSTGMPYELNDFLDITLDNLKELEKIEKIFTFNTYLKGDTTISTEISVIIPGGEINVPIMLVINNVDDYFQIYASVLGQKLFNFTLDQSNGTLSVEVQGQEMIKGKITDEYIEIESGKALPFEFSARLTIKEKKNNSFKGNLVIEMDEFEADFDITLEEGKEFPKVDVSNAEPSENMPESVKEKFAEIFGAYNEVKYNNSFNLIEDNSLGDFA